MKHDCSNMRHKDISNSAGVPHDCCKPRKILWQALGVYYIGMESLNDDIYKKYFILFLVFLRTNGQKLSSFVSLFLVPLEYFYSCMIPIITILWLSSHTDVLPNFVFQLLSWLSLHVLVLYVFLQLVSQDQYYRRLAQW